MNNSIILNNFKAHSIMQQYQKVPHYVFIFNKAGANIEWNVMSPTYYTTLNLSQSKTAAAD